jgi:hypothetical protein
MKVTWGIILHDFYLRNDTMLIRWSKFAHYWFDISMIILFQFINSLFIWFW